MGGFIWKRAYYGISATPLGPADIVGGHALWMATRCFVTSDRSRRRARVRSRRSLVGTDPGDPVAAFTGMAFAMPLMAFDGDRGSWTPASRRCSAS